MKKKLLFSIILTLVAVGAIAVLFLTIKTSGRDRADLPPDPESIDIDIIENDAEFARTVPEQMIMARGLVKEEWSVSFLDIVSEFESKTETAFVTGVRSDGETISLSFTGVRVGELFRELDLLPGVKNVVVYGSDLYAAVIPYDEFVSDDLYIVWKKDGSYMNPSTDGVLKLVQNRGPTKRWVKNPVVFDFISDFSDKVPFADRLDSDTLNFVSQQSLFSLAISRVPEIDIGGYSLAIMGLVRNPTTLTYDEIRNLPQVSIYATLETISNPPGGRMIGNAIWTGVPFSSILETTGPKKGALEVVFRCLDGYSTSISMDEAMKDGVLLAYRVNGEPLSPTHGFPVRLVVPEKYGMKWPKWINEIEIVDYDYKGYWEMRGWSDYAGRDRPDLRYD
jgi:DMSO/TMAO reductase YedYZ molybdopterin-dependent catalytic subunit